MTNNERLGSADCRSEISVQVSDPSLRVSLLYLLFGICWIVLSDGVLVWNGLESSGGFLVSSGKGILYVALSTLLIYFILRRLLQGMSRANSLARAVIDSTTDAVFIKDRQGRYLMCNATVARSVGRSIEDIIGKDDTEFFDLASANSIMICDKRIMESGKAEVEEEELTNGVATCTYLSSKVPFRDADGTVVGVIGVSRDITRRKEAQKLLRLERDRFEKIVEMVPLAICSFQRRVDGSMFFTYASSRIESFLGVSPQELTADASHLFDNIHPDDLNRVRASVEESARLLTNWRAKFRFCSPAASEIWLEGCATPTVQADASVLWHGYIADVTEQHYAESSLNEIQQRLKQAQFIAHMGSWTWEPMTNVVWWSDAIYDLFGYDPARTSPSFEAFLELLDEGDRKVALSRVQSILSGAEGFANELRIHRPDGLVRWVSSVARATRDSQGRLLRVDGFDQDISERRRLEDQLHQSRKMEAVGRLAGGVAHDFNNMLTVIQGYCEVLAFRTPESHNNRASIDAIQQAVDRATQLTRQLLAFSRKAMIEPRSLNLNEIVIQLETLLRRLVAANIEFDIALEPSPCYIEADPTQIDQVILNLVLNSRDAMPSGGRLTIRTRRIQASPAELASTALAAELDLKTASYIELSISDTGCGMTDDVKAKIFEPFFTTKEKGKGTGLGLSVVHGIVRQSRGKIEVVTAVGQGTTFRLLFKEVAAAPAPAKISKSGETRGFETILLVEDEDAVRELFKETLESFGYSVISAASGKAAVSATVKHGGCIHLLVTDLMMPGMSGRELAHDLRLRFADLRVLFMSGYSEETLAQQGIRRGIDAFLHKPFSPLNLAREVRTILDSQLLPAVEKTN